MMKISRKTFDQNMYRISILALGCLIGLAESSAVWAQAVCLPAPRLLNTVPMGGQVGTSVDVRISGDHIDDADVLTFSHPGITAEPKRDADGQPIANQFTVTIASDCPPGIHEARVMTRLGVSSSRVFNVGTLPETIKTKPNTSLETAMPLEINSTCNAVMSARAVDFYTVALQQGQRMVVDCAAKGIDSKLNPVIIVADANGNDLVVERRGGALNFTAPETAQYVIKVHDLTFNGGRFYFYRLVLQEASEDEVIARLPSTRSVSSCSWPPVGLTAVASMTEAEPNNNHENAQAITLPCDISGRFFPAADVDTFEFTAKKGEVWWVEVASERLGRPTDPSIIVQHVGEANGEESLTDVVELTDIASPVKVSSNGYSYDGPPYNAGSTDILGKLEIKQDGVHRLQLSDLFGGTRTDSRNVYRLIIRKAAPDFALAGWALHMNLRNGDRNALSKPIALRGGATMPIEVVAIRRDGFKGDIELKMDNLPEGVTATGLKIPAGQTRGMMLVTAEENAPRGLSRASFIGESLINGETIRRPVQLASMAWPVKNAWSEIPSPRLVADVPVSVSDSEQAPITVTPVSNEPLIATAGEKLTIPLKQIRRCDFSGTKLKVKTFGAGFDRNPAFDVALDADESEAVLDLAKLKTPPGDYTIAFCGSAVAKYRDNLAAVDSAKIALKLAEEKAKTAAMEASQLAEAAKTATEEQKPELTKSAAAAVSRQKSAEQAVKLAQKQLQLATNNAKPKDIVDIVVSRPINIRVQPAEKK
ncbi:serine protease [Thalassoroseus pseudoceratinae]|uniref:serine protease n=1 Tax=Thalassoroseus pseudoceratinae TaxID=2713176 RepID=UPI001F0E05E7|nr:serine protease [Thalassoroseus pseudoceratinae]